MTPTVQWTGDNEREIEHLLRDFVVRADRDGDRCRVIGLKGLNLMLEPGDSLILEGERVGVLRATRAEAAEPCMMWKGDNPREAAEFLKAYKVRVDIVGADLFLYGGNNPKPIVLHRGDCLIERHNRIIISKAGKDHRV